jgi:hydroxycarboxylate dehydrogenase B
MPLISHAAAHKLTEDIFVASGAPLEEARLVADHLVAANLCGVDSHGLIRIPQYAQDVRGGTIRPGAKMKILRETAVSAVVDCGWNFGVVGADRATTVALEKAQTHGIAIVVTRRCNHAGRLGHYLERITEQGLLGLGFCSSPAHGHFVVPWGGRDGRLSTNPLAYGVPVPGKAPIISDFSTSQAPEGRIRLYKHRKQNLPEGWILDSAGEPSISPSDFYGPPRGCILPFGGRLGYRGYALGLLVEVMGTILAGYDSTKDRPGNGVSFVVFDPTLLAESETYRENLGGLGKYIKSSRPVSPSSEVLLPGELERQKRQTRLAKGFEIEAATWSAILEVAAHLKVGIDVSLPSKTDKVVTTSADTKARECDISERPSDGEAKQEEDAQR